MTQVLILEILILQNLWWKGVILRKGSIMMGNWPKHMQGFREVAWVLFIVSFLTVFLYFYISVHLRSLEVIPVSPEACLVQSLCGMGSSVIGLLRAPLMLMNEWMNEIMYEWTNMLTNEWMKGVLWMWFLMLIFYVVCGGLCAWLLSLLSIFICSQNFHIGSGFALSMIECKWLVCTCLPGTKC